MNATLTPSMARGVYVTPRLPDFVFDDAGVPDAWFDGDIGRTAVWSALSVLAGVGEAGFIEAGRWLAESIDDPAVADETRRFMQQEAFHATVHARFNRVLAAKGLPADEVRDLTQSMLVALERFGGRSAYTAAMLAGEQAIGEVAHGALDRLDTFDGVPEKVRALWQWHFFEEVEHQAALHDGWTSVHGQSRAARDLRVLGAAYIVVLLAAAWPVASWAMVPAADRARRSRPATWGAAWQQLLGREGLLRAASRNLRALARVDFHPFDMHDPVPTLDRLRGSLVDSAWERAARPGVRGTAARPVVGRVGPRDLLGLARFTVFAVRTAATFAWRQR